MGKFLPYSESSSKKKSIRIIIMFDVQKSLWCIFEFLFVLNTNYIGLKWQGKYKWLIDHPNTLTMNKIKQKPAQYNSLYENWSGLTVIEIDVVLIKNPISINTWFEFRITCNESWSTVIFFYIYLFHSMEWIFSVCCEDNKNIKELSIN